MSRIHEALKKAAQQRNLQSSNGTGADLIDLATEKLPSVSAPLSAGTATHTLTREETAAPPAIWSYESFVRQCQRAEWQIDTRSSVFSLERDSGAGAEKFRTLRSRLYQISTAQPLRRLIVTSSVPAEGKTFVAANLAQSFVRQPDKHVLLIDADLRASRLHQYFGAVEEPGLTEYLRGEANELEVTQVGLEGNLCLIPGGNTVTNPSELLASDRMKLLLDRMGQIFDWVILDSPPAVAVHDASLLADMCDGVLFVVRAGTTDFETAQKAAGEFHEKNLLGVILNCVDHSEAYGEYYYGYSRTDPE